MGRRGPARKPTALAKLTGSWRAKKRAQTEPVPSSSAPAPPAWLNDEAMQCWQHTTAMLADMNLLSRTDEKLLVRYCQAWARWVKAERVLERRGDTFELKDKAGRVKFVQQRPEVAIAHKLSLLLLRAEQEMGLTPAARARLATPAKGDANSEESRLEREFFGEPHMRLAQ